MPFSPALSLLTSVYKGESYLAPFFENLRAQTIFPETELILVLNEASPVERQIANDFSVRFPIQVNILFVQNRETLGASWNRAWVAARATYLAIWNIDDRRLVDSLQTQLSSMEANPDWALNYGDYVAVPEYGSEKGVRRHTPEYSTSHFRRAFAQGGAFSIFRRNIADQIGYFDEQFQVGPDMEFSFRMAAKGMQMGKCDGLLGFFTDAAQGLSTREGGRNSAVERTAIQLRYGVFDKVRSEFLEEARRFRLDSLKNGDKWLRLTDFLPGHEAYLRRRQPLWALGTIRNTLRSALERLGLLRVLHRIQVSVLKREL